MSFIHYERLTSFDFLEIMTTVILILLVEIDTLTLVFTIFLAVFDILKRAIEAQYYIRGRDGRKERCLF